MHSTYKVCSECGKSFLPAVEHIYKTSHGKHRELQCSYACYRKAQEKNTHKNYASRGRKSG